MNNASGFIVFLLIFLTIAGLIIFQIIRSSKQLEETYRRIAQRFNGRYDLRGFRYQAGGFFGRPRAWFVHNGTSVLIDVHSTGGKNKTHYTQCHLTWPDQHFRCEVYPAGLLSRIGQFLGMKDVEIGSLHFDRDYVIIGSDVRSLRDFLTPAVQESINELCSFGHSYRTFRCYESDFAVRRGHIYFAANGGRLLIKKLGYIRDYAQLERFVLLSLKLYDRAIAACTEGIEFVEPTLTATLSLKEAYCQICGESVKLDAVFCRSCKTPHHKDCWEYYGACSTYGCGDRRFVVAKSTKKTI